MEGKRQPDNEDSIRNLISSNQARTVVLLGVPIVALVMEGQERLCLAQISNTLLKKFSYNEIHNRRVALGITCVQCTPVQLEVLRRAGAMPISSRRCGMISALKIRLMCNFPTSTPQLSQILAKREAERLCKSFLADSPPPKLPDDFEFVVAHKCGWGCRGSFLPSRYNSSRAKCLRCHTCDQFFSPNKFIFHSHRTNDSTYVQPDAANFNSWRRHLHLVEPNIPEGQLHAWEDVKAMFNGGSRKRVGGDTSSAGAGHRQSTQKFDGSRGKRPSGPVGLPIRPSGPPWGEVTPGSFAHLNNVIESAMANPFCWGFPPPPSLLLQPHHKVLSVPQQLYTEDQISDMTAAPSAFRPVELSLDLSVKKTTGRAGAARQEASQE